MCGLPWVTVDASQLGRLGLRSFGFGFSFRRAEASFFAFSAISVQCHFPDLEPRSSITPGTVLWKLMLTLHIYLIDAGIQTSAGSSSFQIFKTINLLPVFIMTQ